MDSYQDTFKRYEMKYLLDEKKYRMLLQRLEEEMKVDHFGKVTVCNIYFDTTDHRLIRSSLEKPIYKEKLRLRSYGTPGEGDTVFVELKKKYKGVVYKRREKLKLPEAEQYLYENGPCSKQSQITKEIDWFMKTYSDLSPAMYISYHRIAMIGIEEPNLRVTFDSNILWREVDLWLESGSWGTPIIQEDQRLMEIKLPGTMPLWLAHILGELEIYPTTFSKYGKSYQLAEQLKKNEFIKGEKVYA